MKLTKADHRFMTVCELDAVDLSNAALIVAMKNETEVIKHRTDYSSRAVRKAYLRLVAYRDLLQMRQRSIARYA